MIESACKTPALDWHGAGIERVRSMATHSQHCPQGADHTLTAKLRLKKILRVCVEVRSTMNRLSYWQVVYGNKTNMAKLATTNLNNQGR